MDDKTFQEQMYKYLDQELNDQDQRKFETHLDHDPLAKMEFEKELKMHEFLKKHMIKEEAPYDLREAIIDQLDGKTVRSSFSKVWGSWFKPAAISFLSAMFIFTVLLRPTESFPVFEASVESHMDVLTGAYPMEIQSSDHAKVAKWFEGKINTAIIVPDFTKQGCELKGARICHLKDRKVALMSYEKEGRKMTVFLVAFDNKEAPHSNPIQQGEKQLFVQSLNGYRSILCLSPKHAGVGCIFVSDMSEEELLALIG